MDYILQRLGFTQARVTIPKWIQRGAMDPFDKVLAELMYQIVVANNGGAGASAAAAPMPSIALAARDAPSVRCESRSANDEGDREQHEDV